MDTQSATTVYIKFDEELTRKKLYGIKNLLKLRNASISGFLKVVLLDYYDKNENDILTLQKIGGMQNGE